MPVDNERAVHQRQTRSVLEPKLVLNDVQFGNPSWAKERDLASVKQVEADVALLPLLQRRFEVIRLKLVDPVITLETGAGGKVNWEFGTGAPAGPPVAAAGAGAASTLANFGIANVVIENGRLTVRDALLLTRNSVVLVSSRFPLRSMYLARTCSSCGGSPGARIDASVERVSTDEPRASARIATPRTGLHRRMACSRGGRQQLHRQERRLAGSRGGA